MEREELSHAIEALLFAAAEPLSVPEIQAVLRRALADASDETRARAVEGTASALELLQERYRDGGSHRGFSLVQVAEGWSFRTHSRYGHFVRALRGERGHRLSKAALETLAIVAYRQPVTKPEVDQIRGVDSGGTLRWLLERGQLRVLGKREEPGRPLLYGTTKEFLSLFSIASLQDLPTLRDARELTDDSRETLEKLHGLSGLAGLQGTVRPLRPQEPGAVGALDDAMAHLRGAEATARDALAREGIALHADADADADADAAGDAAGPPADAGAGGDASVPSTGVPIQGESDH